MIDDRDWEEWFGEAAPDSIDFEWKHEFDGGAGNEGREECIDGAVDMVEW